MRKVLTIASRDYRAAVFSKAFLISLVALPVLWGGSAIAQIFLKDKVDTADRRVAIVDRTGKLSSLIVAAAEQRNSNEIFKANVTPKQQVKPRFVIEVVNLAEIGGPPQSTLKLSDRVRKEELLAFVDIAADLLDSDTSPASAVATTMLPPAKVAYYSNSPTYNDFSKWLNGILNNHIQEIRLGQAGLDRDLVRRASRPEAIDSLGLVSLDKDGNITDADKVNMAASFLVPIGLMLLMFIGVMVGSTPLLQSVLEEKMGRIAEVLLGSATPVQLMLGKLVGTVGVSITIMAIYMAAGYVALWHAGYADLFPTHLLLWFILFLTLSVVMNGALFAAIGAAVTDAQEAQSLLMPAMVVTMAPMFVFMNVIKEPNSTLSMVASLFPPATPMLMILRQSVPPGVPLWQPILGIVLVLATTVASVWAAGRVFRVGILAQGKGASFQQICRWIIQG